MKARNWSNRKIRREVLSRRIIQNGYTPTKEAISESLFETHWLRMHYGELPGVEAYEECVRFLKTQKQRYPIDSSNDWYDLGLKMALNRVKGRRFVNDKGEDDVVSSISDVHQIIREIMRTAGVRGTVKSFIINKS